MKVFFPLYQIESHREPWQSANIVVELSKHGIECVLEMSSSVDAVFVGSIFSVEDAANGYYKQPYNRPIRGYLEFPNVPVIHYCWDLYPWVLLDSNHPEADRWLQYVHELRECTEVWVPTTPVVKRCEEYIGRTPRIVLPPVPFWEPEVSPQDFGYVVDVMRSYPGDPNTGIVKRICDELGIECVETGASLSQREYRKKIANARLLVSAYNEASTGSLALLEGYRLGKQVLISDSPMHGGNDLFRISDSKTASWAFTFDHTDSSSLKNAIENRVKNSISPHWSHHEHRQWCYRLYSDASFAKNVSSLLKEIMK